MELKSFLIKLKGAQLLDKFDKFTGTPVATDNKVYEEWSKLADGEARKGLLGYFFTGVEDLDTTVEAKNYLLNALYDEVEAAEEFDTEKVAKMIEDAKAGFIGEAEEAEAEVATPEPVEEPTPETEPEPEVEEAEAEPEVVEEKPTPEPEPEVEEEVAPEPEPVKESVPLPEKLQETKKAFEAISNKEKPKQPVQPTEASEVLPSSERALIAQLLEALDFELPEPSTNEDETLRKFENMVRAVEIYNNITVPSQRMFHIIAELKKKAGE